MGRAGLRAARGAAGDGAARVLGPEVSGGVRRRGAGCEGDGAARGGARALDVRRLRHHGARAYRYGVAASRECGDAGADQALPPRSEEHTSELQSLAYLVCRLLLEKKKKR